MSHPSAFNARPYTPRFDRGGCGIGFVADQYGRASHGLLRLGARLADQPAAPRRAGRRRAHRRWRGRAHPAPAPPLRPRGRAPHRPLGGSRLNWLSACSSFSRGTAEQCMALAEAALAAQGLRLLAWREVPIRPDAAGRTRAATMPRILARHHRRLTPRTDYISDLSTACTWPANTSSARPRPLGAYVPFVLVAHHRLQGPAARAATARPSTPTCATPITKCRWPSFISATAPTPLPTWQRAQPFRVLCHNGEINTLQGNLAWMKAREPLLEPPDFCQRPSPLRPVIDTDGSDFGHARQRGRAAGAWAGATSATRSPCWCRPPGKSCPICPKPCATSTPTTPA